VGGVGVFGGVEHPEVFEAEAFMHCLPGFWAGGLVCAVIHDGDAGVNRVDEGARVRQVEAVMIDQVKIDRAEEICGADEGNLLGLGEVAEIEKAEFAEGDENPG